MTEARMSSSRKRLILPAMLITLGVSVILIVLQLSVVEEPETYPLGGVWASSFESGYQIDQAEGTYRAREGVVLSHIHVAETGCPYLYDPATNQCLEVDTTNLVGKDEYLRKLVVAHDGRIYAAIGSQKEGVDARLRSFDPATKQSRDLGAIIPSGYHPIDMVAAPDGHIYGAVDNHLFTNDPATDFITDLGIPLNTEGYISGLALSDDRHLYGTIGDFQGQQLFDYDLTTRQVVSLTSNIWYSTINTLVLSTDKKIYGVSARANHGLMYYDLIQHQVSELSQPAGWETAWDIEAAPDGTIYGVTSHYPTYEKFLFRYSPTTDQPIYLEPLPNIYNHARITIHADGRLYFSQDKTQFVYDENSHIQRGVITSTLVETHNLAVSQAEIGEGPIGVGELARGNDGAIYGTTSRAWQPDSSWLFRYDPAEEGNVMPVKLPLPQRRWLGGATALVADQQGRLVAASGSELFIYNPLDHTAVSRSVPISNASAIAALTTGKDGLVYGSVNQGNFSVSHLFAYDPAAGTFEDLGMPLPQGNRVYALAAAPDGRIYGGGGIWSYDSMAPRPNSATYILFAYDPVKRTFSSLGPLVNDTRQIRELLVMPDGTLYFGTGLLFSSQGSFYRYDPLTDQWTELSLPARGDVIALALGHDGLIYGSLANMNGDGHVFTFDPQQPNQPPQLIGASLKTGVTAFLASPNDIMYTAVGGYNSFYRGPAALTGFRTTCSYGTLGAWDRLTYQSTTPPRTRISLDILDANNALLLADVKNGGSLSAIDAQRYPAIKLRATLTTDDPHVTPILGDWRVTYHFRCATHAPSSTPAVTSNGSAPTDIFSIFQLHLPPRIEKCLSKSNIASIWRCLSQ